MSTIPNTKSVPRVMLGFCGAIVLLGASTAQADEPVEGKAVFERYCAICHGMDGKGHGPMAEVLKPTATDLTLITKWNKGDFPYSQVYEVIEGREGLLSHGTGQMPIWGDAFMHDPENHTPYARIMELVMYLRSIQEK